MTTTKIAPVARRQVKRLATNVSPETAVLLAIAALRREGEGQIAHLTLRQIADQADLPPELVGATLLELESQDRVAIETVPTLEALDAELEILAVHRPRDEDPLRLAKVRAPKAAVTLRSNSRNLQRVRKRIGAPPPVGKSGDGPSPEVVSQLWHWADQAADLLDDRDNLACFHAYVNRYSLTVLQRALEIALAYPAERVRTNRGAIFVATVKRLVNVEPRPRSSRASSPTT